MDKHQPPATRYNSILALGSVDYNFFKTDLKYEMKVLGLTQRKLGELSGVDHSTISRILSSDRDPGLELAIRISRALKERRDRRLKFVRVPLPTGSRPLPTLKEIHS